MRNSICVFLHAGGVSRVPVRRPGRTVCMYIYTPVLGNCSMHCSTESSDRSAGRSIPAVVRALLPTQRPKILLS